LAMTDEVSILPRKYAPAMAKANAFFAILQIEGAMNGSW
jgi:hypothetical protein